MSSELSQNESQETNEKAAIEPEEDSNGIDWSDTVLVEDPNKGGVAKGLDALTILDNPKTRTMFMDDLMEATICPELMLYLWRLRPRWCHTLMVLGQDFLKTPDDDVDARGTALTQGNLAAGGIFDSACQRDAVSQWSRYHQYQSVLECTNLRTVRPDCNHFHGNKGQGHSRSANLSQDASSHDDKKFSKICRQIKGFFEKDSDISGQEKEMVIRQKEALQEQGQVEPKLDIIKQKTKKMQKQMEEEISKKYKDRTVNIMGEINVI